MSGKKTRSKIILIAHLINEIIDDDGEILQRYWITL